MKKLVLLLEAATPNTVKVTTTFTDFKQSYIDVNQNTFELNTSILEMEKPNLTMRPSFTQVAKNCLQIPCGALGNISQYTQVAQQVIEAVETVQNIAQMQTNYLTQSPYILGINPEVSELPYSPFRLPQHNLINQQTPPNYVELIPTSPPINMEQQSVQIQYDAQQFDMEHIQQEIYQNLQQGNTRNNVYTQPLHRHQFRSVKGNVTVEARYIGYTEFEVTPDGKVKQALQQNQPEIKYLMVLNIEAEDMQPQQQTEQKIDINDLTEWECFWKALKGEQVIDKKYTLENWWNGNLPPKNISFIKAMEEYRKMKMVTNGAVLKGIWNGLKGMWDGVVVLVTEPEKVSNAICESTSNFMEHPWQSTKEFVSETWGDFVDATWRSTSQEMAEDVGEMVLDIGASAATGGGAKFATQGLQSAANKMKIIAKNLPQHLPDAGKFGTIIAGEAMPALAPAIAGAEGTFLRGGIEISKELPINSSRILMSSADDVLEEGAKKALTATAKKAVEETAERTIKQTTSQAFNEVVSDIVAGVPVVATVKYAAKEAAEQTSKHVAEQAGKQVAEQTGKQVAKQTGKQVAKQTGKQVAEQTGKQVAEQTNTVIQKELSGKKGIGIETSDAVSPTKIKDVSEVAVDALANGIVPTTPIYGPRRIPDALYKKLRKHTPNNELQEMAKKELPIGSDDPLLPGKKVTRPAHADHIVPMDKITKMDGFDKLSDLDKLRVLNYDRNFMAASASANSSRQAKSFAEWLYYKEGKRGEIRVNEKIRQKMMKNEKRLARELQGYIYYLLKLDSGGQ